MDARREPRPFPYDRLRRVARARLPWLRRVARALSGAEVPHAAIESLLGAPTSIDVSPLEHCPAGGLASALSDPVAAVVLEHRSGALEARAALELDPVLAAVVVDRALGGAGDAAVGVVVTPASDAERGALAYVVARLVAAAGLPFVVRGAVTTAAGLAGALGDIGAAVLPAQIRLGDATGHARLWLPERALAASDLRPRPAGRSLARVPLTIAVEAAWGSIDAGELEALRVGDAVLLDESWLEPTGDGFAGHVRARVAGTRRTTLRCALEADGIRVETIDVGVDPGATKGTKMETKTTKDATDRAGDAPLDVSVEIARFTMPLAEIGAVSPGEVLATGRSLGERVTLRINGEAFATGELVDVDGEIGVRVLSLAG